MEDLDDSSLAAGQASSSSKSNPKGSTKRQPKDPAKPKPQTTPTGTRFQCPRCPKNFSRIENLTRHKANHEDVAKFACVICRKRFTRSDLLNRHRRIHGAQTESQPHVTELSYAGAEASPSQADRGFDNLVHRDDRRSASQDGMQNQSPNDPFQSQTHQPHILYQGQIPSQTGYQHLHQNVPGSSSGTFQPQGRSQGLTSLMEAALAPQETLAFTPVENVNPSLWDGFMRMGDTTSSYMGTYDADMSWTLDYLPSDGSPNYLLDQDMVGFDDFGDNPYQYQALQYNTQIPNDVEDAEGEDDDSGDWPDKISRPTTPERHISRVVPRLQPISWQLVQDEARSSGLSITTIHPLQGVNHALRELLLTSLNGSVFRNDMSRPEVSDALFPPPEVLDFFLRLYVRYIQPRFPVLHLPTFDIYTCSPLLLVAMMFLGSSHSRTDRGRFSRLFHDHLRIAIIRIQEVDKKYLRAVDNILTYFLLCLAGTWSGSKYSYEFAEGGRGILVTACRRSRLLDCRNSAAVGAESYQRPGVSPLQAAWLAWVETEKRKRLGLSVYIFDCQYPALFNNQPYVSKAETTNCVFPCPEEYWEAPNAESWKMLLGPADMPPSTYYLHALNCCLLRKWIKPPPPIAKTGEFGKIILMYALHTHIFEWRQSTSMLNPTGLMGTFGNSAHDMGEGLRERRRWLKDGLDSFAECYQTPGTSAPARLLHHLGYVALDVSLSDMHLVAGRSVNKNDGSFAEENLKFWANSEISDSTMSHVYEMLGLCYHCINNGVAADSSFEVAVCLFTGGMVCWAFAKLRAGVPRGQYLEQVRRASIALSQMGCWRMCSMFGKILTGFEVPKRAA